MFLRIILYLTPAYNAIPDTGGKRLEGLELSVGTGQGGVAVEASEAAGMLQRLLESQGTSQQAVQCLGA